MIPFHHTRSLLAVCISCASEGQAVAYNGLQRMFMRLSADASFSRNDRRRRYKQESQDRLPEPASHDDSPLAQSLTNPDQTRIYLYQAGSSQWLGAGWGGWSVPPVQAAPSPVPSASPGSLDPSGSQLCERLTSRRQTGCWRNLGCALELPLQPTGHTLSDQAPKNNKNRDEKYGEGDLTLPEYG